MRLLQLGRHAAGEVLTTVALRTSAPSSASRPGKPLVGAILRAVDLKVYPAEAPFAALILGHGAGAGQTSMFMVRAASEIAARGITAVTFDFPYIAAGRSVPDRAPVLEEAWRAAITAARSRLGALPLFIGGKSMGGRIASQVAAQ